MARIDAAKQKYMNRMKVAYEQDRYTKGMAEFFGVDPSRIASAAPVLNWKAKFDTDADRKERADAWETNLKAAFGLA